MVDDHVVLEREWGFRGGVKYGQRTNWVVVEENGG